MARKPSTQPGPASPRFHLQKAQWEAPGRIIRWREPERANWRSSEALEEKRRKKRKLEDAEPYNAAAVHRLASEAAATRLLSPVSAPSDDARQEQPTTRDQPEAVAGDTVTQVVRNEEEMPADTSTERRPELTTRGRVEEEKKKEVEEQGQKKKKKRKKKQQFKWRDYLARTSHVAASG